MTVRLAVAGAGAIGLAVAREAARAGHRVTVFDPAPASGASWVAGGMLAPVTEAWPGEEDLLELGLDSVARWPGFAAELSADAGADAGLHPEGTVVVATGSGDRDELHALAGHLDSLGRPVQRLTGRELRRLEPAIGPDVRGGLSVPGDPSVDNRLLLAALRAACERGGVRIDERAVESVRDDGTAVTGVRLTDGTEVGADVVVVAAGAHSSSLHPSLAGLVRPVKGEILRLTRRSGALPPPSRTVRALVDGRPVYAVPRVVPGHGDLVIGATTSENGFDTAVTVGGVRDLLRDAERILPGIAEYELTETAAGLRPGSRDNLPLIGRTGPDGLVAATGHGRNGMLLVPVAVAAVAAVLRGDDVPAAARAADPRRFAPAAAERS
ncbi:Glycine oxidase ThiO [Pseudonocardia sp. Ae168_Ps1]|uniref:glycine oxidase ThiO n=1 Tax=unclassified Pseudonocardia TaxID=2619320 RepID=UPI00094AC5C6|nr:MULTISPECIES: glycine oxidase ThiO [unclassified Pseudonocardia]OLL74580.1 Glycine oxidase ThiO [Pseudonocardia sp. Ae150A_Ps1]OLL80559.1 Glycine oxidase ThiO [Pseudonocardia sp. Ae168_Ps1]OLL85311.1 Glycine oxidase ThiO [Pseudonocardia sp. Ae263_Ps1]OLL94662.1 Glycine oxidase ThiO [Pseudonocardia sp. Ae356_Ps1]